MKIAVFPGDDSGCGWYRLRFPARAAQEAGADVVVRDIIDVPRTNGELDFDVAVLQRPIQAEHVMAIPVMHKRGIAVVVDMDDDASCFPPGHPQFQFMHPRWAYKEQQEDGSWRVVQPEEVNWVNAEMACRMADVVTVSTPALKARYGSNGNAVVLRNCVPEEYLSVPSQIDIGGLAMGWTGAPTVHHGDLEVTRLAVGKSLSADWVFRAVDARPDREPADLVHRILAVPEAQRDVVPFQPLRDGYPELVASLDVGIVPLALNRFNNAKSALRGLEYAAMRVPFVASPTSEFRLLADAGIGSVAFKPKDWYRQLRALTTNEELRVEQAGVARQWVEGMTYERHAHLWAEAWELAAHVARAAPRVGRS